LTTGLAHRAFWGGLWVFSGTGIQGVLQLLVVAILARLLAPADFGIVAAALVVVGLSLILSLVGVGPALIQRPRLEPGDLGTGLLITMATGALLTIALFALAPFAATWFKIESLDLVMRGLAPVFLVQALIVVPEALMRRALKYRELSLVQVSSYVLGYAGVGVPLAYLGFGPWALVFAYLAQNVVRLLGMLLLQTFTRDLRLSRQSARALMLFGGGLVAAQIGNYLASYADKAIAGRWLGAHSLGLYSNAFQLMLMPATFIGEVFDALLFPLMSRVSDDPARLTRAYRAGLAAACLIVLPVTGVMFELAPELIAVVFGPYWMDAVLPLKILVLGMLFRSTSRIADALVRARGAVYRGAVRHWLYAAFIVAGALFGQQWGISGLAAGVCVALFLNFLLVTRLSTELTELKLGDLARILRHPIAIGLSSWLLTFLIARVLRDQGLPPAVIVVVCALAVFGSLVILALWRPRTCLGSDGFWLASTLAGQLPPRLRFISERLRNDI
jgi:O-antigen/teichoic acid export membrane protein